MPLDLNSLEDAEKFQKHFVGPLVEAVRGEVKVLVDEQRKEVEALKAKDAAQQADIDAIKASQTKALAVYGLASVIAATSAGAAWNYAWGWVKAKWRI